MQNAMKMALRRPMSDPQRGARIVPLVRRSDCPRAAGKAQESGSGSARFPLLCECRVSGKAKRRRELRARAIAPFPPYGSFAIVRRRASQRSAARLWWRAGRAFFASRPQKKARGDGAPEDARADTPHPVARLAVEPISGKFGRDDRPYGAGALPALHRGVFTAASGRALRGWSGFPSGLAPVVPLSGKRPP